METTPLASRREFLTSAAAYPALALLPAAAQALPPVPIAEASAPPLEPPTWFYARMDQVDGKLIPVDAAGTPKGARGCRGPDTIVRRMQFTPLASAKRYRIAYCDWKPLYPRYDWDSKELKPSEAERAAASDRWWEAKQAYPYPAHTLDVPGPAGEFLAPDVLSEYHADPFDLVTREAGLRDVATQNLEEVANPTGYTLRWAVLLEVGEFFAKPLGKFDVDSSGIGAETVLLCRPVRIVRPTAAEVESIGQQLEWSDDEADDAPDAAAEATKGGAV